MTAYATVKICLTSGAFVSRYYSVTFTVLCSTQYTQALKSNEIYFGDFLSSLVLHVDWEM